MIPARNTSAPASARVKFNTAPVTQGQRVLLYGTGGIGKTTLALSAPGPVVFFDLDESLGLVARGSANMPSVCPALTFADFRSSLQACGWDDIKTIVVDTVTKLEEFAVAHTLATVRHEKGNAVNSVEGYGYGKGPQHVFETFLLLLGEFDRHTRAGRNIILIAHECVSNVPNPAGEDWIRYEPRLQSPTSGKASIRYRLKEWSDHVLFVGYDVAVSKDTRKASGSGTRTLYPCELPHCMAKNRAHLDSPIDLTSDNGAEVWQQIFRR